MSNFISGIVITVYDKNDIKPIEDLELIEVLKNIDWDNAFEPINFNPKGKIHFYYRDIKNNKTIHYVNE